MGAPWARGAECRINGVIHGQQTVNVMHFSSNTVVDDGPELDELLLQIATAMLECAVTTLLPAVTSDWRLVDVTAKAIFPAPGDPVVATAPADSIGELSPTSVSFSSSLVNIRTGGGGRRGRGRIFLPPAGESEIASSALDAPTLLLLTAFLTCVAGKFTGSAPETDWRLGVLSRKNLAGVLGNWDNSFREATQLSPVANVAVMGSRKIGHGR